MTHYIKIRRLGLGLVCFVALGGIAFGGPVLNEADDRITDIAIKTDLATYEYTQGRIAALNGLGIPIADYHLSKAQCWLDVSLHEYTRNDRSVFPQEALSQADGIISSLESKNEPVADTPLVNNADRLREDLWERAGHLKSGKGFSCYAQKLACAEVELVHAGNEHKQQGWRHAKPYIQIAEDLLAEADAIGESCLSPAPVVMAHPIQEIEHLDISADALFRFNKAGINDLLPAGKAELDALVTRLQDGYVEIEKITLVGHTDRLGSDEYNQRLSEQRAQTVRQYLQDKGIISPIEAAGWGEAEQVAQCGSATKATRALVDCLQPNRRVTVEIRGFRKAPN